MTALERLAAAIEAGEFSGDLTGPEMGFPNTSAAVLYDAFSGSLDAAKALHDAVLPGWRFEVRLSTAEIWESYHVAFSADVADNPARAWLLAIVRALIAKEGKE